MLTETDTTTVNEDTSDQLEKQQLVKSKRQFNGWHATVFNGLAALFSLFYLYTAGFGIFSTETHRGMYVMFTFVLCLMLYPSTRRSPRDRISFVDLLLIGLSIASVGYWMFTYKSHMINIGEVSSWDLAFGLTAMFLSFEAVRRALGWPLVIIGSLFVLQLYLGPHLPGYLSSQGFGVSRIVEYMFSGVYAIFGSITNVFATYILPFMIFGGFLEVSGAGDFFINLTTALVGNARGGPAKVAVLGSALMGTISGASVANVVATGNFTIPMMKRTGYRPHVAAAIEAAASTGGQFMPPIMGAGAFILANLTQTPYVKIMIYATIPAILYFLYVGVAVHLEALKTGIKGLPKDQLPDFKTTLAKGWPFLPPFGVLVVLLLLGYSPFLAAFWSVIALVGLTMIKKETRMGPKKIIDALAVGAKNSLSVGATVGVLGMIMGGISMGGIGVKFSAMILYLANGDLLWTLLLTILAGNIIGMGLPTAASYVILSILAAPALIKIGVPIVVSHLFCFWMSLPSNITPPVCVSAIAAAGIAGADPMKTGFASLKYAAILYVMPLAFVYSPAILLYESSFGEVCVSVGSALVGILCLASGLQGYLIDHLSLFKRFLMVAAAISLFVPGILTSSIGIFIFVTILLLQWRCLRSLTVVAKDKTV